MNRVAVVIASQRCNHLGIDRYISVYPRLVIHAIIINAIAKNQVILPGGIIAFVPKVNLKANTILIDYIVTIDLVDCWISPVNTYTDCVADNRIIDDFDWKTSWNREINRSAWIIHKHVINNLRKRNIHKTDYPRSPLIITVIIAKDVSFYNRRC